MKKLNKILLGAMIAGLSSMSFAGSTSATVSANGTFNKGCVFDEPPTYNFDNIPSGTAGISDQIIVYVQCMDTTYQLMPVNDEIKITGGVEELTITAWKNGTQQLTNASPMTVYANGLQANIMYLRVNGPSTNPVDGTRGYSVSKPQSFTVTYPLKVVY